MQGIVVELNCSINFGGVTGLLIINEYFKAVHMTGAGRAIPGYDILWQGGEEILFSIAILILKITQLVHNYVYDEPLQWWSELIESFASYI